MEPTLRAFKALADESRLRILWMLEARELCVCEIQEVLGLAQSTVSRHLKVLEDAGYVVSARDGPWKNYRLHPAPVPLAQGLLAMLRLAAAGDGEAAALREKAGAACREQLCGRSAALARGDEAIMKKRVLFLCTGNSCRSQMAEGWLRHLGGNRYEALSAGTQPQGVNPLAIRVMAEAGVDLSARRSKSVDEFLGQDLDLLVTVCAGAKESCPVFLGKVGERRHWPIDDPAEAQGTEEEVLVIFRRARDELRARVESLVEEE